MFIKKANIKLQVIFTVLFSAALWGKVSAQNDFPIEPPTNDSTKNLKDSVFFWHGLYLDPNFSAGISKPYSGTGIASGLSINAGAEACYMFSKCLGVSAGLQYEQYSFKYSYSNVYNPNTLPVINTTNRSSAYDSIGLGGYTTNVTYTFSFIRVPLLARYISNQQNKFGFYAEAGIMADILMNAKVSGSAGETEYDFHQDANTSFYNYPSTTTNTSDVSSVSPSAATFNMAFHAGLGVIIPAGKRASVMLAYFYEVGLMNGGTGSNDVVKFSDGTYYFYGKSSNYGSLNEQGLKVSFIYKISGK